MIKPFKVIHVSDIKIPERVSYINKKTWHIVLIYKVGRCKREYEIPFDDFGGTPSEGMLRWIAYLCGKKWVTCQHIRELIFHFNWGYPEYKKTRE